MTETTQRGNWSSKMGFILAGAGSAIGLGNIWRFPYVVGMNGGAIFVMFYLLFIVLVGYPVMVAELTLGRKTEKNPVGALKALFPESAWKYVGYLGVFTGFMIFSWYCVIAGWVVGYLYKVATGAFNGISSSETTGQIFTEFTANPVSEIGLGLSFIALTAFVVYKGVQGGIEKWSKVLMPVLLVLLVLLALRSLTLPNMSEGLIFYLKPDVSKINIQMLLAAMGQALFSLSLGMGTMITYGSYLSKKDNIPSSAGWICGFDTGIALLAGFVILPAVAAMGAQYNAGPGLLFIALPSIFASMPGGQFFGVGLFALIGIAALTSTVSILEVPVSYFVDEKKWSRQKSVIIVSSVSFLFMIPAALASGASGFLTNLPGLGIDFFTIVSTIFGDVTLALGSMFIAIFVAWRWGLVNAHDEINQGCEDFKLKGMWDFSLKYIAPIFILAVFLQTFYSQIISLFL